MTARIATGRSVPATSFGFSVSQATAPATSGGLHEQLYLSNGPLGSLIGSGKGSLVDSLATGEMEPSAQVERIFLSVLSRTPSKEETERFVEFLAVKGRRPTNQIGEAMRILMTCSEFRFNH